MFPTVWETILLMEPSNFKKVSCAAYRITMAMEINTLVSSHMLAQFVSDSDCGRPVVTRAYT